MARGDNGDALSTATKNANCNLLQRVYLAAEFSFRNVVEWPSRAYQFVGSHATAGGASLSSVAGYLRFADQHEPSEEVAS
jgi:hypothetical protein